MNHISGRGQDIPNNLFNPTLDPKNLVSCRLDIRNLPKGQGLLTLFGIYLTMNLLGGILLNLI